MVRWAGWISYCAVCNISLVFSLYFVNIPKLSIRLLKAQRFFINRSLYYALLYGRRVESLLTLNKQTWQEEFLILSFFYVGASLHARVHDAPLLWKETPVTQKWARKKGECSSRGCLRFKRDLYILPDFMVWNAFSLYVWNRSFMTHIVKRIRIKGLL